MKVISELRHLAIPSYVFIVYTYSELVGLQSLAIVTGHTMGVF